MRLPLPEVLRDEAQFRLLFFGQALSVLGDRIAFVALPFAVLSVGGSASDVGLVAGAQTLPFLLLSLVAGVWADRVERRAIMIISDLVRLACQVIAGLLLISGDVEPWQLAVLAFVYGAGDAFFSPAMLGLMPQIVAPSNLQAANALRGLTFSTGLVLGPALAAGLVAAAGPGTALLADAGTFAISVACLARLRPANAERGAEHESDFLAGLRGGWREVRGRSWVLAFLLAMAAYHVIVLPSIFVLGPVLFEEDLGGAGAWGVVVAAFGAGSVIGDLLLLRWRPPKALRAAGLCLIVASCQAAVIGSGLPVAAIAALECVCGVCVNCFFTLWETSLQEHIPEHALSRVASYDTFASAGTIPLGAAVAGPVAETAGLQPTLLGMTAVGIAFTLAALAVPAVRRLPRGTAAPA